jgi:hypothetical protein
MSFSIRHSTDIDDIIDISWRQSRSKTEVLVLEVGTMNDLMPKSTAEQIREQLKLNNIKVRQMSNFRLQADYTKITDYNSQIQAKYIDPKIFKVSSEIVIFENTVAIYTVKPSVSYLEINDSNYANMMRDLFNNIWKISDTMIVGIGGGEEAKQYKPITTKLKVGKKTVPAVIYPAKDDGCIEKAFDRKYKGSIEKYLQECALKFKDEFSKADLIVAYAWNDGKERIIDPWFLTRNHISDDSGFLYDAITIKEGEIIKDMGFASGNSNIVMTAEELLLRELILERGLSFTEAADRTKYFPKFPAGMRPEEEFYI